MVNGTAARKYHPNVTAIELRSSVMLNKPVTKDSGMNVVASQVNLARL
jgi:hypothetical protein